MYSSAKLSSTALGITPGKSKMLRHLVSFLVILLCCAICKATYSCNAQLASQNYDEAIDFIHKGKCFVLIQPDCKNVTQRGMDCSELLKIGYNKSGVYTIWPKSRVTDNKPLQVYCDMETDGGGWTLIQRRGPFGRDADYFYKDWKSYKEGFGDVGKDFWLGNDNIFALTNQELYTLRIDLMDFENVTKYAQYDAFWIDDENYKYTLHVSDYVGDAGDSLIEHHDNQKFSAKDEHNDNRDSDHCSVFLRGGWWYNDCHASNLNGRYYDEATHGNSSSGISWLSWKGYYEFMKTTEMKIRPKKFRPPVGSLNITPL